MARCGAITEKGKRCRNRVADGRQWCHKHPRGRSGYLPVAKKRRRSSQRSVVVKAKKRRTRSSTPQLTAQRRRAERISHRAAKSAAVVDAQWSKAVLDQLDALVGLGTASDLRSADCAAMARVADQLLGGRRRRRGTGLFTLIFGPRGPTPWRVPFAKALSCYLTKRISPRRGRCSRLVWRSVAALVSHSPSVHASRLRPALKRSGRSSRSFALQ